jgi:hypothetical protein
MIPRNQNEYLNSLEQAFFTQARDFSQTIQTRNAHFFSAAKRAVVIRMIALDRIVEDFERLAHDQRTFDRMLEEDLLLYAFLANARSVIDSFCFGAYFVGTQLSPSVFDPDPKLRDIGLGHVLNCFRQFAERCPFTKSLIAVRDAPEFQEIDFRNVFLHRLNPGRTIRPMVDQHSVNLDMWSEGDWSNAGPGAVKPAKKIFILEPNQLIRLRDWLDQRFEFLGGELTALASLIYG